AAPRDGRPLAFLHRLGDVLQLVVAKQQIARDIASLMLRGKRRAGQRAERRAEGGQSYCNGYSHASPPARSASGPFLRREPALRSSALLYQVSRAAIPTMMTRPRPLTSDCIHTAQATSNMA